MTGSSGNQVFHPWGGRQGGKGRGLGTDQQLADAGGAAGFMTLRAFVLGSVLCIVSAVADPYWTLYLQTSRLYADYHTAGATFFLFVLLVVCNFGLGRLWKGFGLRASELMAIGAMMLVGGSILSSGLIAYFIPAISSVYERANTSNLWNEMWQYLPAWASPKDPNGGIVAIHKFWMGLPPGEPIPMRPWIKPLVLWGVMLMAFFTALMAMMVIMRKQWVDYEHLSFPIAQVPAELCAAAEPQSGPSILHSVPFWLGVGSSLALASAGGVSHYLGSAAEYRIRTTVDLGGGPWQLSVYLDVVVAGLVFLIPNRVAFSVWAVALLSWVVRAFMKSYNLALPDDIYGGEMNQVAMGGTIVFVISSIWLTRGHLKRALRCALGTGDEGYDYGEAASYRAAFILMLVCLLVVVVWFRVAGLGLVHCVALVLATVAIYYAMARVVAQCGLPVLSPPAYPNQFMATMFGTAAIGDKGLGVLSLHYGSYFDMRNSVMSGAAHGMYLTRRRRSGLMWAMLFGLVLSYVAACVSAVWVCYRKGGVNMDPWFFGNFPRIPWDWMRAAITQHEGPSYLRMVWCGAGALLMAGLIIAQRTFFWWPLHPVGILIASSHMVAYFWASVFAAWLIKVVVVGFGGYGGYRTARVFFIGAVLGYFLGGGIWNIIDTFTGATLNSVFYI
jgi:hypothetical protein